MSLEKVAKIIIEKKWVRQLKVRHVIHVACSAWVWPPYGWFFLSSYWTKIYSLDQHQNFELYLLRLLCSSQTSTTQSNHRFIEDCHIWNWKSVWIVSIWSEWPNWMFHFRLFAKKPASFPLDALGYIQECTSSTNVWKCCFYLVDCWTTIRSITFHQTCSRILSYLETCE